MKRCLRFITRENVFIARIAIVVTGIRTSVACNESLDEAISIRDGRKGGAPSRRRGPAMAATTNPMASSCGVMTSMHFRRRVKETTSDSMRSLIACNTKRDDCNTKRDACNRMLHRGVTGSDDGISGGAPEIGVAHFVVAPRHVARRIVPVS